MKNQGLSFLGVPDPNKPDSPTNDPTYVKGLQTCAAQSNIVQALQEMQTAQNNLTPDQIETQNKQYLAWRDCMIGHGWKIPEPKPDSKGRLLSFGADNSGPQIEPACRPQSGDIFDSSDFARLREAIASGSWGIGRRMSSSRKKWIGAAAAVALVVVGVVVFTSRDKGSASDKDLIITAAVKRQTLQDKVTLSGTLGRVEQRKVNAPAEGRISRTYLDDGADVQPGQAILAIDGRDSVAEPGDFPFYRPLDVGAQGPDVKQLEQILAAAGYNPGPIDELYTEQTRFALAQWQADHNYPGAASRTAKTVTVSLQPNGNGYKIGAQNTAAVTIGPDLGTPSGPVGRAKPRQSGGGLPRLSIRALSQKTQEGAPAQFIVEVDRDITSPIDFTVNLSGVASESDVVAPGREDHDPRGRPAGAAEHPHDRRRRRGGRRGAHGQPGRR